MKQGKSALAKDNKSRYHAQPLKTGDENWSGTAWLSGNKETHRATHR